MSDETRKVWAAGLAPDRLLELDPSAATIPLPHPDDSFDAILCLEAIEHLPDTRALLVELERVLAPEGVLLISLPEGAELTEEIRRRFPAVRALGRLTAIQAERVTLRERLAATEAEAARILELEVEAEEAGRRYEDLHRELETRDKIISDMAASPSWRMTKPLRGLKDRLGPRGA